MNDAVLTKVVFHRSRDWTDDEARSVAMWLRQKASDLVRERSMYSDKMTCHYFKAAEAL